MKDTATLALRSRRFMAFASLLAVCAVTLAAAEQTFTAKVSGNCGSCKKRIVKAAKSVDGVATADWDKKTKQLSVTFEDTKTSSTKILQAVVAAGHDADTLKASPEVYKDLPECCLYRDNAKTH